MTNLNKLSVSLTKHGAHKIATLIYLYPAAEILNHLQGTVDGINIETAQAKKNLSVNSRNQVPTLWQDAKAYGKEAINGLTLIAIIFSHFKLIDAMIKTTSRNPYEGTIRRDVDLTGKEYTNFSHTLDQLGFSKDISQNQTTYNLKNLFEVDGLSKLTQRLLDLKLKTAGWDGANPLIDEAISLNFHKVFSVSESELRSWFAEATDSTTPEANLTDDDKYFFSSKPQQTLSKEFSFASGHTEKLEGSIKVSQPKNHAEAELLHNKIQNNLYSHLCTVYGKENVGCEIDTGYGTSIDLAVKQDSDIWFYEIKTAQDVKISIRQAIPQLLEYAYWPNENRASRLIIVSHLPITEDAKIYLETLQSRFKIPIQYQQFSIATKTLAA